MNILDKSMVGDIDMTMTATAMTTTATTTTMTAMIAVVTIVRMRKNTGGAVVQRHVPVLRGIEHRQHTTLLSLT